MIINQAAAIGDILFIEPICRHIWNTTGIKPILPVRDHLFWISEYIDSADFRLMSQYPIDYDSMSMEDKNYLPLRFANQIVRGLAPDDHHDYANMMLDKYILAGLDPMLWKTLIINFNEQKSDRLFKHLNLKATDEYVLVNENSQAGIVNIFPKGAFCQYRVIKMSEVPGFNVLDWWKVMMYAKENHHVSTCTFYILDAIKYTGKVTMYPRPNQDGLQGISKLNPTFIYDPR